MPTTSEEQTRLNETNVYDDNYLGNYLDLIGKLYFSQLDVQNKTISAANHIYCEHSFSYGVFSYEPNVYDWHSIKTIEKSGTFRVDIIGNILSSVSLKSSDSDDKSFRFASGYISSYL